MIVIISLSKHKYIRIENFPYLDIDDINVIMTNRHKQRCGEETRTVPRILQLRENWSSSSPSSTSSPSWSWSPWWSHSSPHILPKVRDWQWDPPARTRRCHQVKKDFLTILNIQFLISLFNRSVIDSAIAAFVLETIVRHADPAKVISQICNSKITPTPQLCPF